MNKNGKYSILSSPRDNARGGELTLTSVDGAAIHDDAPSSIMDKSASTSLDNPSQINEEIENSWSFTAELCFPVFYCNPHEPLPLNEIMYQVSNLFELTRNVRGLGGMIARFNPGKYPVVPGGMKNNRSTWKKLSSDIILESKKTGKAILVSAGSHGKDSDRMVLVCNRFRVYRKKADKDNDQGKEGARQIKRTRTSKANSSGSNCKAKLVIGVDSHSFFLVCGLGNNMHSGHLPLSSEEMSLTRKRTVPEEAAAIAKPVAISGANHGLIAGVLKGQFNFENNSNKPTRVDGESARTEALPHVQDFLKAYEGISDQEARKWARDELDTLTSKLNQIRQQEQGSAASGSVQI
jgi:hypothetical protein